MPKFPDWHSRYYYDVHTDGYFDTRDRLSISRSHFDARYSGVRCTSIHDDDELVEASILFDQLRPQELNGTTYAPGEGAVYEGKGNRWTDARPAGVAFADEEEIAEWMVHVEQLVPNKKEREHVLDWMAYKVQRPAGKVNHAILHYGASGCGKSLMWAPFFKAVGQVRHMQGDDLDVHGVELETEVLVLEDLNQKHDPLFANSVKRLIAAPPLTLMIRADHGEYEIPNRLSVVAMTSTHTSIKLADDDRRWFCIHSTASHLLDTRGRVRAEYIYRWLEEGGYDKVAYFLQTRDVSKFKTGDAGDALNTDAKAFLIDNGRSDAEAAIRELIDEVSFEKGPADRRKGGRADVRFNGANEFFGCGVVGGPFHKLTERLSKHTGVAITRDDLLLALRNAGWTDRGIIKTRAFTYDQHVFCHPELYFRANTELRLTLERFEQRKGQH